MGVEIWWPGHLSAAPGSGGDPGAEHGVRSLRSVPLPSQPSPGNAHREAGDGDSQDGLGGQLPAPQGSGGRVPARLGPSEAPAPRRAWACLARSARAGQIRMRAACAYWYAGAGPARA